MKMELDADRLGQKSHDTEQNSSWTRHRVVCIVFKEIVQHNFIARTSGRLASMHGQLSVDVLRGLRSILKYPLF